jgi:pilus assembly protein CpaB
MNLENKKQAATIIFAVGLGLIAAFLTSQYVKSSIENQTRILAEEYKKRSAAVVQEMEVVKREMTNMARRQEQLDQQQKQLQDLQKQVKTAQEQAAEAVRQAKAGASRSPRGETSDAPAAAERVPVFSLRTPPGKRAVTILIDALSAVGGLVNPGDMVDVIAQLTIPKGFHPGGDKDLVTTVLFQNLQVLAVNTQFEPLETQASYNQQQNSREINLTLAMDPNEAALMSFAQTNGKLQLALRSPADRGGITEMDIASWETLSDYIMEAQGTNLQIPKKKSAVAVSAGTSEEITPFVQVFRGGREL